MRSIKQPKLRNLSKVLLILVFDATGCSEQPYDTTEQDVRVLAEIRHRLEEAENAGDIESVRPLFADDIVMMAPGRAPVLGLESAAESIQKAFDAFEFRVEYRSEESAVAGDWGFDRGTSIGTLTPKAGGTPITENSKYLWLYGRESDGSWKLTHVIWNSNGPASGAQ